MFNISVFCPSCHLESDEIHVHSVNSGLGSNLNIVFTASQSNLMYVFTVEFVVLFQNGVSISFMFSVAKLSCKHSHV